MNLIFLANLFDKIAENYHNNFGNALILMVTGMVGIFVVMIVLMIAIFILNKTTENKKDSKDTDKDKPEN